MPARKTKPAPKDAKGGTGTGDVPKYSAPALEKGLSLLTFLAGQDTSLTLTSIAQQTGRGSGEVFRLLQVLQGEGFVSQDRNGYSLTPKLLQIGMEKPPLRNLVEVALPVMRRLAIDTAQSCHLVFESQGEIVVVARMESVERLGFSVRVGYRQPLHLTGSGKVLYAFQPPEVRAEWEAKFDPRPSSAELAQFRKQASAIHADGHARSESAFTHGVTDLAAPILRGENAAATLAIPFIGHRIGGVPIDEVLNLLKTATRSISSELALIDSRA